MTPELLDKIEAEYAPKDHPVFELVPQAFHERAENLYVAMGQPVVMTETFWAIYCDFLKQLCDGSDEVLPEILNSHEQSLAQQDIKMALLPDMEPFRLGQPLDIARNGNYIGGLDVSALPSDVPVPHPECADFTSDDETDNSED